MRIHKGFVPWLFIVFVVMLTIFLMFGEKNSEQEYQIEIEMGEVYYHERIDQMRIDKARKELRNLSKKPIPLPCSAQRALIRVAEAAFKELDKRKERK